MQQEWQIFITDLQASIQETELAYKNAGVEIHPVLADEHKHLKWLIPVADMLGSRLQGLPISPSKTHSYLRFRYDETANHAPLPIDLWVEAISDTHFRVWQVPSGESIAKGKIVADGGSSEVVQQLAQTIQSIV